MGNGKKVKQLVALVVAMVMVFQITASAIAPNNKDKAVNEKAKYNVTQLIVKFKDGTSWDKIKNKAVQKDGLRIAKKVKDLKAKNTEVIDVGTTDNMDNAIDTLNKTPGVMMVAPNYKVSSTAYTENPMFTQQWAVKNTGQTVGGQVGVVGTDIGAVSAWDLATGNGITVGVLDTGIDISNAELAASIDPRGYNFADKNSDVYANATEDAHGTEIAGIIAAADNTSGIIGVAPKTKILPLKFMKGTTGYTADAIDAIEYAKTLGIKIINCSFGSSEFNFALKEEMNSAGMLFVCAAGNDGNGGVSYPAAFGLTNVISVGAVDCKGKITDYTSSGTTQDVYAPGDKILTTAPNNTFTTVSGTSFSAAYVTGIAALVS